MKVYKYWHLAKAQALAEGKEIEIKCYGGSNVSAADAQAQAREKIERIKRKIAGDQHAFDDYEVEIREEVLQEIDERAVITRNRYGAKVLNVEDLMIMDIDSPPFSFWDLFLRPSPESAKRRILARVRELAQKPPYCYCGFRVYETKKGIRVIVVGRKFDPRSPETMAMMKEFHCDELYMRLCQRQGCFRARLTPKPSRMRLRAYRIKFPREPEEEENFQSWLAEYEGACIKYRACAFVEQIGAGVGGEAVRWHDEIAGAQRDLKLA